MTTPDLRKAILEREAWCVDRLEINENEVCLSGWALSVPSFCLLQRVGCNLLGWFCKMARLCRFIENLECPGGKYWAMRAQNMTFLHPAALVGLAKTILPFGEEKELSTSSLFRLCERMSLSDHRNLFLPSSCWHSHPSGRIFS